MKVEYKIRPCLCGRQTDHEHTTMERYMITERDENGEVYSQSYNHGYDEEDDHIYELIDECKRDNPGWSYTVSLIRTEQV